MNLTYEIIENGYKILDNGRPWIVQDGYIPYPATTLEESAQLHINELIKANEPQPVQEDLVTRITELEQKNLLMQQALDELLLGGM